VGSWGRGALLALSPQPAAQVIDVCVCGPLKACLRSLRAHTLYDYHTQWVSDFNRLLAQKPNATLPTYEPPAPSLATIIKLIHTIATTTFAKDTFAKAVSRTFEDIGIFPFDNGTYAPYVSHERRLKRRSGLLRFAALSKEPGEFAAPALTGKHFGAYALLDDVALGRDDMDLMGAFDDAEADEEAAAGGEEAAAGAEAGGAGAGAGGAHAAGGAGAPAAGDGSAM